MKKKLDKKFTDTSGLKTILPITLPNDIFENVLVFLDLRLLHSMLRVSREWNMMATNAINIHHINYKLSGDTPKITITPNGNIDDVQPMEKNGHHFRNSTINPQQISVSDFFNFPTVEMDSDLFGAHNDFVYSVASTSQEIYRDRIVNEVAAHMGRRWDVYNRWIIKTRRDLLVTVEVHERVTDFYYLRPNYKVDSEGFKENKQCAVQ
jgi:hypothetical protein